MKHHSLLLTVVLASAAIISAQKVPTASPRATAIINPATDVHVSSAVKPALRVNGAQFTEIDVKREMYAIFPYARQHNGFPKSMEAEIRNGAVQMIIFEELLYQDAKRRHIQVSPARLTRAVNAFRQMYPDKAKYDEYLRVECNGSPQVLKEKIRRSLLIEQMLNSQVEQKSIVTLAETRAYYDKNPKLYQHGETVNIQTISIIPPQNASTAVLLESRTKIKELARLGKATKTSRDFGAIAEQVSEDDWHTRMGDRGAMDVSALPPDVAKAARAMKPGSVSDPISLGTSWVVFRLNSHQPAGRTPFSQVRGKLQSDLRKQKREQVRASLNQKLRRNANVEVL